MELHHLPFVIPFLFLIVWLEYRHNKAHHPESYQFKSTVLNICCGIIERVFDLYILVGTYFLYYFLQSQFGFFEINNNVWWQWLICFVAVDFLVYWYHRGGHEINFLWASHVTHHQCKEFNFTVAFRNHIFPNIFRGIWLGILPVLGFPAEMIIICLSISGLWQFALHTTAIGKLGFLEKILSTPSAHRVHHASNEQYLDKNFGGFFITWDRMFGTYASEEEMVRYGITDGKELSSPLEAYTHVWKDLTTMSLLTSSWKEKIKIWFGSPGDFYEKYKNILSPNKEKMPSSLSAPMIYYITLQLVLTTLTLIGVMVFESFLNPLQLFLMAAGLIFSAISICNLLQIKKYTFKMEKMRIVAFGIMLLLILPLNVVYAILIMIMAATIFIGLDYAEFDWKKRKAVWLTYVK